MAVQFHFDIRPKRADVIPASKCAVRKEETEFSPLHLVPKIVFLGLPTVAVDITAATRPKVVPIGSDMFQKILLPLRVCPNGCAGIRLEFAKFLDLLDCERMLSCEAKNVLP